MIYSKTCAYALRALFYLASKGKWVFTMIQEVSREAGVPAPYIAKVFQCLVRNGILESRRGPHGGFAFKRPPETISLFEIVKIIDDVSPLTNQCVMGLNKCSPADACLLHVVWASARESIQELLERTTLTQMRKKDREIPLVPLHSSAFANQQGFDNRCTAREAGEGTVYDGKRRPF